jgi:hypothetical protein
MGLGTIFANIGEKIRSFFSGFSALSSLKDKIKINTKAIIIIAGALGIIIVLLLILSIVTRRAAKLQEAAESAMYIEAPIIRERLPSEDFFLPYEPDFVPDILLEKEPKNPWDETDARPFWTDPLEGNQGTWRKRIESGIDSLLERVP